MGFTRLARNRELHNGLIEGLNSLIEKPIDSYIGL